MVAARPSQGRRACGRAGPSAPRPVKGRECARMSGRQAVCVRACVPGYVHARLRVGRAACAGLSVPGCVCSRLRVCPAWAGPTEGRSGVLSFGGSFLGKRLPSCHWGLHDGSLAHDLSVVSPRLSCSSCVLRDPWGRGAGGHSPPARRGSAGGGGPGLAGVVRTPRPPSPPLTPPLCSFQGRCAGGTSTRTRTSRGRWSARGRTPTPATSSTRWRATSCAWTGPCRTRGTTSECPAARGVGGVGLGRAEEAGAAGPPSGKRGALWDAA